MATAPATPRRTRPKDRKQRILDTAAQLFRDNGFHDVGMTEIAAAVGIVPSALYRHYRSKHDLLVAALDESLAGFEDAFDAGQGWRDMVDRAAPVAFGRRAFGMLWERDGGNLSPAEHEKFRHRLRRLGDQLADGIADLGGTRVDSQTRAWAVMALLDLPAHRRVEASTREQPRLLAEVAVAVVTHPLADPRDQDDRAATAPGGLRPVTRRETVLTDAIALFARFGYPNVSLEDIGRASGIAGPSIYNHFDSKLAILVRGLHRASEALWLDLDSTLRQAADADQALDGLLRGYTHFAYEHSDLVTILQSQTQVLPDEERSQVSRSYQEYTNEWLTLIGQTRPDLPAATARALIDMALAVINGLVRIRHLRRPSLALDAAELARAALRAPIGPPGGASP